MNRPLSSILFDASLHAACAKPHLLRLRETLSQINHGPLTELADDSQGLLEVLSTIESEVEFTRNDKAAKAAA